MFGPFAWDLGSRLKDGEGGIVADPVLLWERPLLDGGARLGNYSKASGRSDAT